MLPPPPPPLALSLPLFLLHSDRAPASLPLLLVISSLPSLLATGNSRQDDNDDANSLTLFFLSPSLPPSAHNTHTYVHVHPPPPITRVRSPSASPRLRPLSSPSHLESAPPRNKYDGESCGNGWSLFPIRLCALPLVLRIVWHLRKYTGGPALNSRIPKHVSYVGNKDWNPGK